MNSVRKEATSILTKSILCEMWCLFDWNLQMQVSGYLWSSLVEFPDHLFSIFIWFLYLSSIYVWISYEQVIVLKIHKGEKKKSLKIFEGNK